MLIGELALTTPMVLSMTYNVFCTWLQAALVSPDICLCITQIRLKCETSETEHILPARPLCFDVADTRLLIF